MYGGFFFPSSSVEAARTPEAQLPGDVPGGTAGKERDQSEKLFYYM